MSFRKKKTRKENYKVRTSGYFHGEDSLSLTNTRLLRIARSIHEDRTLSTQRKSAYVGSRALMMFVLNHTMVDVNVELVNLTAKYGCLEV